MMHLCGWGRSQDEGGGLVVNFVILFVALSNMYYVLHVEVQRRVHRPERSAICRGR